MIDSAQPARLGRRVAAVVIDGGVAAVIGGMAAGILGAIVLATGGDVPLFAATIGTAAVGVAWMLVQSLMQGRGGSIGMRLMGLRLARPGDDGPFGFGRALLRHLLWLAGGLIVVGYFSPLFDRSPWRRGWHDRATGAVVVDATGRVAAPAPAEPAADPIAPSRPEGLPAGPILPAASDPELEGWRAGKVEPAPTPEPTGVISFVPGVSDPDRVVPPAPPAPPAPVAQVAPSADPEPLARIAWDDGTRQALYGRTVFGRNPAPETGAMCVPVRDETLSLSKTHFELTPAGDGGLWVVDRHSTNGVVIRRGRQRQSVPAGERMRVSAGDVLEFGDRHLMIEGTR